MLRRSIWMTAVAGFVVAVASLYASHATAQTQMNTTLQASRYADNEGTVPKIRIGLGDSEPQTRGAWGDQCGEGQKACGSGCCGSRDACCTKADGTNYCDPGGRCPATTGSLGALPSMSQSTRQLFKDWRSKPQTLGSR